MNIYIKAMEIGNDCEKSGISYHRLRDVLNKVHGYKMDPQREFTFLQWFIENFKCHDSNTVNIENAILNYVKMRLMPGRDNELEFDLVYDNWLRNRFFLSGQASKQYIDYLELQQSREAAERSQDAAIKSQESADESLRLARKAQTNTIIGLVLTGIATVVSILAVLGLTKQETTVKTTPDNYTELTTEETPLYEPEQLKVSKDMKLDEFVQLSQLKQHEIVFNEGTYVDDIREEKQTFALYSVGAFWVEITYDRKNNKVLRLKPFEDGKLLDKFVLE